MADDVLCVYTTNSGKVPRGTKGGREKEYLYKGGCDKDHHPAERLYEKTPETLLSLIMFEKVALATGVNGDYLFRASSFLESITLDDVYLSIRNERRGIGESRTPPTS